MSIIRRDYYKKGSYNFICDQSGMKGKIESARMQWDGILVLEGWFEPKQPQLTIRPRPDNPAREPVRNVEPRNLVFPPFTNNEIV